MTKPKPTRAQREVLEALATDKAKLLELDTYDGKPVDWFIMGRRDYGIPRINRSTGNALKTHGWLDETERDYSFVQYTISAAGREAIAEKE